MGCASSKIEEVESSEKNCIIQDPSNEQRVVFTEVKTAEISVTPNKTPPDTNSVKQCTECPHDSQVDSLSIKQCSQHGLY